MRVLQFIRSESGHTAELCTDVVGVPVPPRVTKILERLRAATNSWQESASVAVEDEEHDVLGKFRDDVHAVFEKLEARIEKLVIKSKTPRRSEALGWVIALRGHAMRYGEAKAN